MPGRRFRIFSREFKEAAVRRILAGEKIRTVANELRLRPQLLYTWLDYYEQGGADTLVPRGRPPKGIAWARRRALVQQPSRQARAYGHAGSDPARDSRLVDLERKVGQQGVGLEFFRQALRHAQAPPRPGGGDILFARRGGAFGPAPPGSRHDWRVVPNLARGMQVTGLDQLWVADITYLRLLEEFAFLAVVIDAFSRRVVGWAVEVHLRAALAVTALQMALSARRPQPGQLIHHSDRGVQYACAEYSAVLAAHGIQPSMSRVGSPYDNAKAESFMSTLKREEVDGRAYRTAHEARRSIGSFIEEVYNRQRLHSALNYLTPADFEATVVPLIVSRRREHAVNRA